MNRFNSLALATLVTLAAACSNTAKGVEKDADQMGDKAATAVEQTGDAAARTTDAASASMGAAMETADVKTALMADARRCRRYRCRTRTRTAETVDVEWHRADCRPEEARGGSRRVARRQEYRVVNNLTIRPK
ncbi:MAG: hypothetical protein U5K74_12205 [Gemmatimonadaceae bacterium]|nr:hypothetical protein [Gemmatimonadaceae bacterium]